MKIGPIRFNGLCLAPMEDVSDLAFRLTCKHYGAGMLYTEMCHTRSLIRGHMKRAEIDESERPIGIQVAGSDVNEVVEAAQALESRADLIDINLGCPGKKVVACGMGSALLANPQLIGSIVSSLKSAVSVPVTAKMRAGISSDANALLIAKTIEDAGGDAVAVHPRTKDQRYSGRADWSIIKAVKEKVSIAVIGNGDVRSGKDAAEMFSTTGCDAVMIGRAAIGDPLIFKRVLQYLSEDGREGEPISTVEEKIAAFELYVKFAKKFGMLTKARVLRQSQHVTRYIPGASPFRHSLSIVKDPEEIVKKTVEYLGRQQEATINHSP